AWQRILVVLAGPVMNLVFPVLLYFTVYIADGPFAPPTVGVVLPGHPAKGVLEPGDRIMAVNGIEVGTFEEVRRMVERSPGDVLTFKVFRDNRHVELDVKVQEQKRQLELDLTERYGTIGIQPNSPAAVVGIASPDSPSYRAGLRTFDIVTSVAGQPIRRFMDLETELQRNRGETVPVGYLRPSRVVGVLGGVADLAVLEAGVVALTPQSQAGTLLERTGLELADLYAAAVPAGSYLFQAGLRPGDRLVSLDGQKLPAWSTFVDQLRGGLDNEHQFDFVSARDGRARSGTFRVRREDFVNSSGGTSSVYVLPCGSWANLAEQGQIGCDARTVQQWLPLSLEERVEHPEPVRYALTKAVRETLEVTRFISVAFLRLVQGRISLQEISGPISIYEIAGQERRKGTEYFLWVMALVSINLGLLNLLPIPVLDGGHLLFFLVEGVLRRPVPMRVREIAHIFGMAVLLFLMGVAFKNDVEKRWDLIKGQFQSIPKAFSSADRAANGAENGADPG
ncbi:MAG TPA: site-2 protease family protein, partial [Polyangiaceae bacterium]|nr:site-2 protease family protein [Polyangiaceae bacterium]